MTPNTRTLQRAAVALLLATVCQTAWASKFATGIELIVDFILLGLTAGAAAFVAACLGRSRIALASGMAAVAVIAAVMPTLVPTATWDLRSTSAPASVAAMLGYALGWSVTRWPGLRRPAVALMLAQNAFVALAFVAEPIVGLLGAAVSALTIPLLLAIGLRRLVEGFMGAENSERRDRADAAVQATFDQLDAQLQRAGDALARSWVGAFMRRMFGVRRALAARSAEVAADVRRSRFRRAYVTGLAVYLAGFALAAADPATPGFVLTLAMEPGRILHAMAAGDLQPLPDSMPVAWLLYGLACSVAAGAATLWLPVRSAPPMRRRV